MLYICFTYKYILYILYMYIKILVKRKQEQPYQIKFRANKVDKERYITKKVNLPRRYNNLKSVDNKQQMYKISEAKSDRT